MHSIYKYEHTLAYTEKQYGIEANEIDCTAFLIQIYASVSSSINEDLKIIFFPRGIVRIKCVKAQECLEITSHNICLLFLLVASPLVQVCKHTVCLNSAIWHSLNG